MVTRIERAGLVLSVMAAACANPAPPAPPSPAAAPSAAPVVQPARGAAPLATLPPDVGHRLVAQHAVVTSANPLASEAGLEMLRKGGNAVDAAVATAFAIGVVEPQMSGLGAGGAMLVWRQAEKRVDYLDFYSSQPAAAFRGHTDPAADRARDLRVVAVPGDVAGLLTALKRFGKLDRATVMAPAIRLAEQGYPVNQILAQMIVMDSAKLNRFDGGALFWPGGRPLGPGALVRNPELAASLRRVAEQGIDGYYTGPIAERVVAVMNAGGHPVTLKDFAAYRPQWKRPLCGDYRGMVVLSAPPPQTGIQILHTLELLEPYNLSQLGLPTRSARAFDVLTSALRVGMLASAFNDDPRWSDVPARGITSEAYAREQASQVGTGHAEDSVRAGNPATFDDAPPPADCRPYDPWGAAGREAGADASATRAGTPSFAGVASGASQPLRPATRTWTTGAATRAAREAGRPGETTHISVVDADGNAVALTQTNSSVFGSGAFADGFFLNDSGYRFRADQLSDSLPAQWRTRNSTISPTIVLKDGQVRMVVGAPGGGRIPTAVAQDMVYVLDYGMDPMAAVRMPRIFPSPRRPEVQIENGFAARTLHDVRAMGYRPAALSFGYARLYMIVREGDVWVGVADPRHDGEARGY
ncbi:MAG: gamma-glutamyltransferase family protein [Gemmatimonadota bacterium]